MKFESDLAGKHVLVTGAGGCIGAWTIKSLNEIGAIPVAYDLSDNRERLELITENADSVIWETGDISDYTRLLDVLGEHQVAAIIHLAALQVPFCKADPVGSTKVNVMGSINVLEAARELGIRRISYASSIASPAMGDNDSLATLYGAHKVCGEQMAAVYWQDWQVSSVGIRPSIIYGPGRDQGMSAAPTIAILAAFAGIDYNIPFSGPVSYVHVEDAAARFIAAVARETNGAPVFDLTGTPVDTPKVVEEVEHALPNANISFSGSAMPFPADNNNAALDNFLNIAPCRKFSIGVSDTIANFEQARSRGVLDQAMINRLIEKNS